MSFSRPPFYESSVSPVKRDSIRRGMSPSGSLRSIRTDLNSCVNASGSGIRRPEEDLDSVRRPAFESRPINQPSLTRQRWTERRPPAFTLRHVASDEEGAHVLKLHRNQKRDAARDLGRSRKEGYKWKPQIGNATSQSVSDYPQTNSNNQSAEPQMFSALAPRVGLSDPTIEMAQGLTTAMNDATYTLNKVADLMSETVKHAMPNGKLVVETKLEPQLASTLVNLSEFAVILVVIILVVLIKPKTPMEKALVLAVLLGLAATRVNLSTALQDSGLLSWINRKGSEKEPEDVYHDARPEMFTDFNGDEVTTIITSMLNLYVLGSFGTSVLEPKELLKVTSQISRMTPTVTNITAGITLLVGVLSKLFRSALGTDGYVRTGTEFIDAFFKEFEEIVDLYESKQLYTRQSSVDRVKACLKYGQNVAINLPGSPSKYVAIRMQVAAANVQLEKIRTKLMSSNFKYTGCRQEPATMLLMGKPGVFKSQAMQHVCNAINASTLSREEYARYRESPTTSTYTFQHENVYHEGYTQDKNVTLIDDFGQARDVQGTPDNEYMNIIRMVNIFENVLHMATLEDKGNTHFRSKFVIANTNLFSFNPESINEKAAVLRRFHVVATVYPRKEYCIDPEAPVLERKFDYARFPLHTEETCGGNKKLIGTTRTHPEMCEFSMQKLNATGEIFMDAGEVLSFNQLVGRLYEQYHIQCTRHASYLQTLDDTLNFFREQAFPEEFVDGKYVAMPEMNSNWTYAEEGDPLPFTNDLSCGDMSRGHRTIRTRRCDGDVPWSKLSRFDTVNLADGRDMPDTLPLVLWDELNIVPRTGLTLGECEALEGLTPYGMSLVIHIRDSIHWRPDMDYLACESHLFQEYFEYLKRLRKVMENFFWSEMKIPFCQTRIRAFDLMRLKAWVEGHAVYLGLVPCNHAMLVFIDDPCITYRGRMSRPSKEAPFIAPHVGDTVFAKVTRPSPNSGPFERKRSIVTKYLEGEWIQDDEEEDLPFSASDLESPTASPEMFKTDWSSASSFDLSVPSGPATTVPKPLPAWARSTLQIGPYRLRAAAENQMFYWRSTDFMRYSLYDQALNQIVSVRRWERDEYIDLNDLFDVMTRLDIKTFEDVTQATNYNLDLFVEAALQAYDSRPGPVVKRPDMSLVNNLLADAKKGATSIQERLYGLYQSCVFYCTSIGMTAGDAVLAPLIESPQLRQQLGAFVAVASGFSVAIGAARVLLRAILPVGDVHSDERHSKTGRASRKTQRTPRVKSGIPHSVATQNKNVCNVIDMIAKNSTFEVHLPHIPEDREVKGKTHYVAGFATAIRGRAMMMPWHFWSQMYSDMDYGELGKDDHVIFKRPGTNVVHLVLSVPEFVDGGALYEPGEKQDVILVAMPKRYQPVRDLVRHFAQIKQHNNYTKVDSILVIPRPSREIWNVVPASQGRDMEVGDDSWEKYTVGLLYTYPGQTGPGDCGSLLYANDKQSSATIIGMHVAGISGLRTGCSAKITREFLEDYLEWMGETYKTEEIGEGENKLHLLPTKEVVANQVTVGHASPESRFPARMSKSAIIDSPLKDTYYVSPKTQSALWKIKVDGQIVDPLVKAREGYCPGDIFIDPEYLEAAKDSLLDFLVHNSSKGVEKCIMNFQQAVLGDGPGSALQSIPRKTSSGYPYNCTVRPANKTYFFGDGDEFDFSNPRAKELEQECFRCLDLIKRGIRPNFVFTDSLKDEKLKKEKVAIGKTRMFSGSPIVYTILCRMYFGKFAEWCTLNRIDNGMAIGVNQYSTEWDYAAQKLNQFGTGPNKGAGDYSGLDKNEKPQVHDKLIDLVNEWYGMSSKSSTYGEDCMIREALGLELTNSLHICDGLVTYWTGAMPSGHFLTALFNGLNVHMFFRMTWLDLVRPIRLDAHEFNEKAYLIVLGDDHVYSVRDDYRHIFTEERVGASMAKWGQIYTPETKSGDLSKVLRTLEEVSFLKRRWVYEPAVSRYLAPLDLETTLDIPNWIKKGGNALGDTEVNLDNCLAELCLHGKETYNLWKGKIVEAVDDIPGLSLPPIISYRQRLRDTLNRDGNLFEDSQPLTDYDMIGGNTTAIKPESGRFGGEEGGLFRLTSRMPCWQPQLYPGNRGGAKRLARRAPFIRAATNVTDELGDSSTGRTIVSQVEEGSSGVNGSTTQSSADAGVAEASIVYKPLSRDMLENMKTDVSNQIRDFLAKPKLISAGTLTTGDTYTVPKWSAWVPNDLVNVPGDIWLNKLEGTFAFRGTLHLTLTVNGNRFQQGRYILGVCPTGGCNGGQEAFRQLHTCTLTETTQLPHVELDVNCDTEAHLEIPTMNATGWIPLSTTNPLFGATGWAFLRAYSPLVAPSGSASANYTIFAHFTNVEIAMPIVPQSARPKGRIVRRRPADMEASSGGIGPIESGAAKVALAAKTLTGVPLLASVAAPVSWAADLLRNAASAYGWSRPRNEGTTAYIMKQVMHRAGNVDAPDNSTKLALFDRNELGDLPDFAGSPIDEMAIQYLVTQSAYINQITWPGTAVTGAKLLSVNLTPRGLVNTTSQASTTITHTTPLAYISQFFGLWRGGIKLTIKLVKTEFHSGRLAVVFVPNSYPVAQAADPSFDKTVFLHRNIIDVRNGNEFTFEFPYVGFTQYKFTSTTHANSSIGQVCVYVVNSLVAPATVSSSVTMLCEWSACSDFEFAQPINPIGSPAIQGLPQIGKDVWVPQIGRSDCEIVAAPVGGAGNIHPSAIAETCIGEKILSLRSLLKKFSQVRPFTLPSGGAGIRTVIVRPHAVSIGVMSFTPAWFPGTTRPDMFDRIACMYAFYRGGIRMKFANIDKIGDSNMITSAIKSDSFFNNPNVIQYGTTLTDEDILNRPFAFARGDAQGASEVEFPFYSITPMMCVGDYLVNETTTPQTGNRSPLGPNVFGYCAQQETAGTTRPYPAIYRAMAEDGSFGLFVSTPPVVGYLADGGY